MATSDSSSDSSGSDSDSDSDSDSGSDSSGDGSGDSVRSSDAGNPGCSVPAAAQAGEVATSRGLVRGAAATGTWRFLGIPYAEPPVGERRFAEAEPRGCWDAPMQADDYGAVCPQVPATGKDKGKTIGAEDCLRLSVWTPTASLGDGPDKGDGKARPVWVFVHGGEQREAAQRPRHGPTYPFGSGTFHRRTSRRRAKIGPARSLAVQPGHPRRGAAGSTQQDPLRGAGDLRKDGIFTDGRLRRRPGVADLRSNPARHRRPPPEPAAAQRALRRHLGRRVDGGLPRAPDPAGPDGGGGEPADARVGGGQQRDADAARAERRGLRALVAGPTTNEFLEFETSLAEVQAFADRWNPNTPAPSTDAGPGPGGPTLR